MPDINLLPEILKEKQKSAKTHFLINGLSIILLIFTSAILAVLFSYRLSVTQNLNTLSQEVRVLENSIEQFREQEGLHKYINLKITAFATNLEERKVYGSQITKIKEVLSNTAIITKINIEKDGKASISGESASFPELSKKFTALEKTEVFEVFEIASLRLNQEKGSVEFGIEGKLE